MAKAILQGIMKGEKKVRKAVEEMGKHQISRTGMGFPECSEAREMWESPRRPPRLRD